MNELSYLEKSIYNTYLHTLRTLRGKPFSPRKDFAEFKENDAFHLKRIVNFLNRFPHIRPVDYFKAPLILYETQDYFGLDYYSGMPAVKSYTLFMKQLQEKDPDSEDQMEFIERSLRFIGSYCVQHKIKLEDYPKFKTGVTYDWMKHIKNNEISIYCLMEFRELFDKVMEVPDDERDLFLGDLCNRFYTFKDRYMKSQIAKHFVKLGIEKIKEVIERKIQVDKV